MENRFILMSMPVPRLIPVLFVLLTLTFGALSYVHADFTVRNVDIQNADGQLTVSTDIDLNLTTEVEAAVTNGVPLVLLTEIRVVRPGLLWDSALNEVKNRFRLRYHALSDHYIVEMPDSQGIEMFRTVDDALKRIGTLRDVGLALPDSKPNTAYRLAVRSRLDIDALPGPLRPMAFLSTNWRLNTDWTYWQILP